MKKNLFGLIGVITILSFACSKPETVVNGEAWVVTQGSGKYKFGLLEISVIPETAMLSHLQLKNNDLAVAAAKKEFDAAILASNSSVQSFGKAFQNVRQKSKDYDAAAAASLEVDPSGEKLRRSYDKWDDYSSSAEVKRSISKRVEGDRAVLANARSKLNSLSSRASYFEGLPPAVVKVKTHSDGKFSFKLPPGTGRYAIVAHATRNVLDRNEDYYWAVWIDAAGKGQTLVLSNDNLTTSGSATSAISATIYE